VPYSARRTLQLSIVGTTPVKLTTTGDFNGVNKTDSEIAIRGVASSRATQHDQAGRMPVP
jgi:hypothetical protein